MAQRLVLAAIACVLAVSESVVVIKTSGFAADGSSRAKKSGCVGAACKEVVSGNEKTGAASLNASLVHATLAGRDAEFKQGRRLEETTAEPVAVPAVDTTTGAPAVGPSTTAAPTVGTTGASATAYCPFLPGPNSPCNTAACKSKETTEACQKIVARYCVSEAGKAPADYKDTGCLGMVRDTSVTTPTTTKAPDAAPAYCPFLPGPNR